ncbi:unnamed protein product [Aphanomyces euteiches]
MASHNKVWYELVDEHGNSMKDDGQEKIVSSFKDISAFRNHLFSMNQEFLNLHDANNLVVYPNMEAFKNQEPLNDDASLPMESSLQDAIIVVVDPTKPPPSKKQRLEDVKQQFIPYWIDSDDWQAFLSSPGLEVDDTNFFRALLSAPVVPVTSLDDLPISKCSQVKIHTYTDESTKVQVVCLPYAIPKSRVLESHVLFIRPFHVDFVKAIIACPRGGVAVIGNAGIGNSFLQLVILLWWARSELRPDSSMDTFFDIIHVIARVERHHKTDIFFKKERLHFGIKHRYQPELWDLDNKSTLLLYEPGVSTDEIQIYGITQGYAWATVSPLESRYKQFSKANCVKKYMGCATEEEILFMAAVLDKGIDIDSELKPLYTSASVHQRLQRFGPVHRVILPTGTGILTMERHHADMVMANLDVMESLRACDISDGNTVAQLSRSRFVLRMEPTKGKSYGPYTLQPASDLAKEKLTDGLLSIDIGLIHSLLTSYNDDPNSWLISYAVKVLIPILLEVYFVKGVLETNTFGWKTCNATRDTASANSALENWKDFSLNVNRIDNTKSPTYAQIMDSRNTLFYMNDAGYPLADCFWYDHKSKTVNAGQISKSFSPSNTIHSIEAMNEKLQTPTSGKIVINVVVLPRQVDQCMACLMEIIDDFPANMEFNVVRVALG